MGTLILFVWTAAISCVVLGLDLNSRGSARRKVGNISSNKAKQSNTIKSFCYINSKAVDLCVDKQKI